MTRPFEVRGSHVLGALLAFFAMVVAANAAFLYFAVKSYPGEKERKSYRQGLAFNAILEARAAQDALGWRASIDGVACDAAGCAIAVALRDADGAPLDGLALAGAVTRPASDDGAQLLVFTPARGGRYHTLAAIDRGAWDIDVTASTSSGGAFRFHNRIIVP